MTRLAADAPAGASQLVLDRRINLRGATSLFVGDQLVELAQQSWQDRVVRLLDPLPVAAAAGTIVQLVLG